MSMSLNCDDASARSTTSTASACQGGFLFLSELLAPDRTLRLVNDRIWSALPEGGPDQRYDRRAAAYDRVVGSRLYNRVLWGSSPAAYAAFAARAVSSDAGPMLDAGCGSLVFTAGTLRHGRPSTGAARSVVGDVGSGAEPPESGSPWLPG